MCVHYDPGCHVSIASRLDLNSGDLLDLLRIVTVLININPFAFTKTGPPPRFETTAD